MKILLLGGTKFVGPHLLVAAAARGHELTRFHRSAFPPDLAGDRDPDEEPGLEALEGGEWDAVIDTSGYHPRIVRASAELLSPHIGRYLFVSTVSVYADHSQPFRTEDAPLAHGDEGYGALKAACETVVREVYGDRALIVRPGLIVGPGDPTDRFTYWPVRVDRGGSVLAPGDGRDPVQLIDVRDLADWLIRLLEDQASGTFHAVGPERPTTIAGLLSACGARDVTWVPTDFLQSHGVKPWSDLPVWIPRASEDGGHNQLDNSRALAAGLRCRPLRQTAADTLAWWKEQPASRRAVLGNGLTPEREAELLRARRADSPDAGAS